MSKRSSRTKSQTNYRSSRKSIELKQQKQKEFTTQTFEFVNKYSNYLNCSLCHQLMKNPTRLYTCGHTFCFDCINTTNCFNCNKKIILKQKDLIAIGMINELKVKCLNNGCPFNGSYEQYLNDHGKNCKLKQGIDKWMLKMQALMQDFSTCKMKQTKLNQDEQVKQNENVLNIIQKQGISNQSYKSEKIWSFDSKQKEKQQISKNGMNLRDFVLEQQLLQKKIMKEL